MKKLIVLILMTNCIGSLYSQELIKEFNLKLSAGENYHYFSNSEADILPIVNNENRSIFFFDKSSIYGFLYKNNLDETDSIIGKSLSQLSYHTKLINGVFSDDKYLIVHGNGMKKSFKTTSIDFHSNLVQVLGNELVLKKEKYLSSFIWKNKLFLLAVSKKNPELLFYELLKNGEYKKMTFDLTDVNISSKYHPSLHSLIKAQPIQVIVTDIENSLAVTHSKIKLYVDNDKVTFTNDMGIDATTVVDFDLINNQFTHSVLKKPSIGTQSNSFIFGKHIFQASFGFNQGLITISDLYSKNMLKELKIAADEEISFINGAIEQEVSGTQYQDKKRTITKTKQLLRKITNSKVSISVNALGKDKVIMTVGSYKPFSTYQPAVNNYTPGTSFSTPAGTITTAPTFNQTFQSYSTHEGTTSAYFKSILSTDNFTHIERRGSSNVFDRIDSYKNRIYDNEKFVKLETVYLDGTDYIYGYYHRKEKIYRLVKFEN